MGWATIASKTCQAMMSNSAMPAVSEFVPDQHHCDAPGHPDEDQPERAPITETGACRLR